MIRDNKITEIILRFIELLAHPEPQMKAVVAFNPQVKRFHAFDL